MKTITGHNSITKKKYNGIECVIYHTVGNICDQINKQLMLE